MWTWCTGQDVVQPRTRLNLTDVCAEQTDMADERVVVSRWRRYGKDRLYASLADGTRAGWCDLVTGATTIEVESLRTACEIAFARYVVSSPVKVPTASGSAPAGAAPTESAADARTAVSAPTTTLQEMTSGPLLSAAAVTLEAGSRAPAREGTMASPSVSLPTVAGMPSSWKDLAANRPGQDLKVEAARLRRAAPVRTVLARVLGVHTDERARRLGAKGEDLVAARLDGLGLPWRVLHAVKVRERGTDIDHIVIGPAGVFTLNTKHHPGKKIVVKGEHLRVDGYLTRYVSTARSEARRATRSLSAACGRPVPVQPLIVVVGCELDVREQPRDVNVIGCRDIAGWLQGRPADLVAADVDAIFEQARRSTTWMPPSSQGESPGVV